MDKNSTKILLSCVFCTIIVFLLFLVAIRFNQLTCELVRIEPADLRRAQLKTFDSKRPIRSHDKTMLMKISAYLEYNIPASNSDKSIPITATPTPSTTSTTLSTSNANDVAQTSSNHQHQTSHNMTQQQQVSIQQLGSLLGQPNTNQSISPFHSGSATTSSITSTNNGTTSTNQHQTAPSNITIPTTTATIQQSNNGRDEERFLPLDLEEIETKKVGDNKFKYTLTFNCSTLNIVFVRSSRGVFAESMSLVLEPKSQRKSTCDILLPPPAINGLINAPGTFQADAVNGTAHLICKQPIKFKCWYFSGPRPSVSQQYSAISTPHFVRDNFNLDPVGQSANGQLIAELHINAIEFETITNSSDKVKPDSWKNNPTKNCDFPSPQPAVPAQA